MPCDTPSGQAYCDEPVLQDHDGRSGSGPCGRACRAGQTKCEDHLPMREVAVPSPDGAAHLRVVDHPSGRLQALVGAAPHELPADLPPDYTPRGRTVMPPFHVPAFCGAAVFPLDGAPREACGHELPCPDHGVPGCDLVPLTAARAAYEEAEREVARCKRVHEELKARAEVAAKEVTVAAHKAHELANRYVEILRS